MLSPEEFARCSAPLIGMPVTRARRGHGSAILLDLGKLRRDPLPNGRHQLKGRGTVMLEWSWRVEGPRSIRFGSWSSDRRMSAGLAGLCGQRVLGISVEGRLPEIVLSLSERTWVRSFSTVEGQPEWTLFLEDGDVVSVAGGRVKRLR